jgi:hypothetical protein
MRNHLLVLVLVLVGALIEAKKEEDLIPVNNCLIHNFEYVQEYLEMKKDPNYFGQMRAFTKPLKTIRKEKSFKKIEWRFLPVNSSENLFYLLSQHTRHYLCASNLAFMKKASGRGRIISVSDEFHVVLGFKSSQLNEYCQWRLVKVNVPKQEPDLIKKYRYTYEIWNVNYNESFYAANYLQQGSSSLRNTLIGHVKSDSDRFKWKINCKSE